MSEKKPEITPELSAWKEFEQLQERVEHLEEINRFTLDALELASSLMDFQPSINNLDSPAHILSETFSRISTLLDFKNMAIYLVSEKDSDFYLAECRPPEDKAMLDKQVQDYIHKGFFSWAMRDKKPLILASSQPELQSVLHVMTTSSRTRGMFVGTIQSDSSRVPDVSWALLSIVLSSSANAIESFELYRLFKETNTQLRRSVQSRTRQLEVQSSYDQLTHLPNRDMILKKLEKAINSPTSTGETRQVAFLLIDLDMFKDINESLGHHLGDKLLIQVGFRLREIVQDHDHLGRIGGDEFAIILQGPDCRQQAVGLAGKIIKSMLEPFDLEGQSVILDVSIGIAVYPDHGKSMGQILSKADIAMYASKRKKTGYTIYDPRLDNSGINRVSLMGELKNSLNRKELCLYFQPKISLPAESLSGAEALLRWIHPSRGFIPPSDFIPLAEQGGLIRQVTALVVDMAAAAVKEWNEQGFFLSLSINISTRDIQEGTLPGLVESCLKKYRINPRQLEMEVTESAFMSAPRNAARILSSLRKTGVRISIDDFGTGYSSLSYLKELPVDILKIDRSFVMNMDQDPNDAKIVKSIIDLGHNLDLRVVAEGVENRQILDRLKVLGCDMAQGFYIMKPAPPKEFAAWIRNQNKA
ncbi:MAG: putative bifunctional diguanylate cyclase/phosphodiesterase [Desulfonatronovibrionaceae bacterium]